MIKSILLLILFVFSFSSYSGGLDEYMNVVSSYCPSANKLIIKKSLIELTQDQNCKSSFTSLLLKDCPQLNCTVLIGFLTSLNSVQNGAVIGK